MATVIDEVLKAARESNPDLWKRTEQVARIIDPSAFEDGWVVISPESSQRLHNAKLKYLRSNAMCKAQEVLKFLGVNTDADWHDILTRMSQR